MNTQQPTGMEQRFEQMLDLPEGGARELAYETGNEIASMAIEAGAKMLLGPLADAFLFCGKVRGIYQKAKEKALLKLEMFRKDTRIAEAEGIAGDIHGAGYAVGEEVKPRIDAFLGIAPQQVDPAVAAQEQALQNMVTMMAQQEALAAQQEEQLGAIVRAEGPNGADPDAAAATFGSLLQGHGHMADMLRQPEVVAQQAAVATISGKATAQAHAVLATPNDLPPLPADITDPVVRDPVEEMPATAEDSQQLETLLPASMLPVSADVVPYLERTKQWNVASLERFRRIIESDPDYAPYRVDIDALAQRLAAADPAQFERTSWVAELKKIPGLSACDGVDHWIAVGGRTTPDELANQALGVEIDFLQIAKDASVDACTRWMDAFQPQGLSESDRAQLIAMIQEKNPEWFREHTWIELVATVPSMEGYTFSQPGESMVIRSAQMYATLIRRAGFDRFRLTPAIAQSMQKVIAEYREATKPADAGSWDEIEAAERMPLNIILNHAIAQSRCRDGAMRNDNRLRYDAKIALSRLLIPRT